MSTDDITDEEIAAIFDRGACTVCGLTPNQCLCVCVVCGQLEKFWDEYEPQEENKVLLRHVHRKRNNEPLLSGRP